MILVTTFLLPMTLPTRGLMEQRVVKCLVKCVVK
jgi:hypothetical protein